MKKIMLVCMVTFIMLMGNANASYAAAINTAQIYVYSYDGKSFLGSLSTNTYNANSVFNTYGNYGSKYNTASMWNPYGTYGSRYSSYSATNPYTSTPPVLVYHGKVVGYVTANSYVSHGVALQNLWSFALSF